MSAASDLLAKLGVARDETLSVAVGHPRNRRKVRVADLPAVIEQHTGQEMWWACNPTNPDTGTATVDDVVRMAVLHAEFDVKGFSTREKCVAAMTALFEAFGPAKAVVDSSGPGGGTHVYWVLTDGWIIPGVFTVGDADALLKRFGSLVQRIAKVHGAEADSVFDTTRLLRVPGTSNTKYAPPRLVEVRAVTADGAGAYTRADIVARLTRAEKLYPPVKPVAAPSQLPFVAPTGDYQGRVLACTDKVLAELSASQPGHRNPEQNAKSLGLFRLWLGASLDLDRLGELIFATQVTNGQVADDGEAQVRGTIRSSRRKAESDGPEYLEDRRGGREPITPAHTIDPTELNETSNMKGDKYSHLPPDERAYQRRFDRLTEEIAPLEATLFGSRESLRAIRAGALKHRASPLATLASVLARVLVQTPKNIMVDSGTMVPCSVNEFTILAGAPGDGKDSSYVVAKRFTPLNGIPDVTPSSGESIASKFFREVQDPDDPKKPITERIDAVMMRVNEFSSMSGAAKRDGAILYPQLCSAYSGQRLGQDRADQRKSRVVEEGDYRFCAIVSAQPALTGPLFEQQSGIAERWLWVPALSREATLANKRANLYATTSPLDLPSHLDISRATQINGEIIVPQAVTDELDAARDRHVLGLSLRAEVHTPQTRLKVMWGLALIDGRVQPGIEDWELAGVLMAISTHVREWCRGEADKGEQINEIRRARNQGVAASVRSATARYEDDKSAYHAAMAVVAFLRGRPNMKAMDSAITRGVNEQHRPHLRRAYALLDTDGVIRRDPPNKGRGGEWVLELPDWPEG